MTLAAGLKNNSSIDLVYETVGVELRSVVCLYLHQLVQHHGVEPGQVLDVVALHDGTVLPDVSPELLHVEDQLRYVSAGHTEQTLLSTGLRLKQQQPDKDMVIIQQCFNCDALLQALKDAQCSQIMIKKISYRYIKVKICWTG